MAKNRREGSSGERVRMRRPLPPSLCFTPPTPRFTRRGVIRIFRLHDKHEIQTIEAPTYEIESLVFTLDGKQIVAGLRDTSIVIWDVRP